MEPGGGRARRCIGDLIHGASNASAATQLSGTAAGQEIHTEIMILALAVRHRAGRPAMSMEGGT